MKMMLGELLQDLRYRDERSKLSKSPPPWICGPGWLVLGHPSRLEVVDLFCKPDSGLRISLGCSREPR